MHAIGAFGGIETVFPRIGWGAASGGTAQALFGSPASGRHFP